MSGTQTQRRPWPLFWLLFGAGWALFAFLAATNGRMVTPVSPLGIIDHQVAGSAARVDAIQAAWAQAGQLDFARLSMSIDLVFIAVLTAAGVIGGALIAGGRGPVLRALGWLTIGAFLVYGAADYAETVPQLVQAMSKGADGLAQLAARANKIKVAGFLAGHAALLAGLVGARLAPRPA